jgi:signal transduction histidine kinase
VARHTARHALLAEKSRLASEAEAARAAADAANAAKDVFLAKLAHELRGPLAAVKGWTEIARRRADAPAEVRRAMDVIDNNTTVQQRLIEDLLDLNRVVSGTLALDKVALPLELVLRSAADSVQVYADARKVHLELDIEPVQVAGDSTRLHQVFTNLVGNAIKFSNAGGRVHVELRVRGNHAHVCIRDGGVGLTPEQAEKVFEPFWQVSGQQARGGLGLGLAIVRSLTELHGGTVSVSSEGLGHGCLFEVVLPALTTERPTA